MSDETLDKRIGFASFFSNSKEVSSDLLTPARSPSHIRAVLSKSKSHEVATYRVPGHPHKRQHHSSSGLTQNGESAKSVSKSNSSTKRNFKCIADPELDKSLPKGSKPKLRYGIQSVSHGVSVCDV